MPDWFTHVLIGLIIAEVFSVRKKSLVLIGTIIPDILPKLVLLRLFIPIPSINYTVLKAFHTPFVIFIAILLIAPLFKYSYKKVVALMGAGALSHLLADAALRHFAGGVRLLYPISMRKYAFNFFWPNESFIIMVPLLIIYITIVAMHRKNANLST